MGKNFLITTAIDYPSGKPHMGHAYEKICTDVIARFKRLQGVKVHFSTGLDEHGSKIQKCAEKAGMEPKAYVDRMARFFIDLCKAYDISYDDFIRTTEERHAKVVNQIFERVNSSGDIYKGEYEGPYCTDCETYYTEKDLKNGYCPVHKKPAEYVREESYFFRMSKYQKQLEEHIRKNPDYIMPKGKPEEILNRMKPGVKDLSISRTKIDWGLPLPIDKKHTQYVWMDALINYLSTIGGPESSEFKEYWPALHIIGTDIVWHHTVIWGSILMSAGIELPRVFVHGFINLKGQKMSKSGGAVVDPMELAKKYPSDAIRYFLIRDIPFGEDGDFSEDALKERINGELVSDLGNLTSRVLTLAEKAGVKPEGKPELEKELNIGKVERHMEKLELHLALDEVMRFVRAANKYINEKEPWKLMKDEMRARPASSKKLGSVIYNLLESLRIIGILIEPFMPNTSKAINEQLGVEKGLLKDCVFREWDGNAKKGEYLFQKIE
ncbi:MAG: methionine--tRNA ligase [Candidatus Aenigmatarchaeota archaeon]|nr:MAG: methionine--tRNA ligase [Candidatus Aenigmarchaeota archaeon]